MTNNRLSRAGLRRFSTAVVCGLAASAGAHDGDILVSVDLTTNELRLVYSWDFTQPADFLIEGFPGWWNNDVLLEEDDTGDPRENTVPIDAGTEIVMIFENWTPGLVLFPAGDLGNPYDQEGQELFLGVGGTGFRPRAWWYIDSTHPDFNPSTSVYTVDLRVIDLTGTHLPSASYTFMVEPIPEACEPDMTGSGDPNSPWYGVPNGSIDVDDFFYFLDQFSVSSEEADLTGSSDPGDNSYGRPDGDVDADDFFYFLDVFTRGCRF